MKKIISLIFAVSILFSSFCLAETDPVVGAWYIYTDFITYPELKQLSDGNDYMLSVLLFMENGTIIEVDTSIVGEDVDSTVSPSGHWEKTNNGYNYKLIGMGEGTFSIDGDQIILNMPSELNYSFRLRKIITMNPYKDFIY